MIKLTDLSALGSQLFGQASAESCGGGVPIQTAKSLHINFPLTAFLNSYRVSKEKAFKGKFGRHPASKM